MTLTDTLADLYSIPPADVERWPGAVREVLYRNAVRRGWLVPDLIIPATEGQT